MVFLSTRKKRKSLLLQPCLKLLNGCNIEISQLDILALSVSNNKNKDNANAEAVKEITAALTVL